ncbi:cytochrome c family protein, partial [Pseudomonas sp. FW305-3-2-15-E-TSA4]|nr:cytochrome c family protein [Pseudomonas sp. FW305-3-2-15-E-TSA4]
AEGAPATEATGEAPAVGEPATTQATPAAPPAATSPAPPNS